MYNSLQAGFGEEDAKGHIICTTSSKPTSLTITRQHRVPKALQIVSKANVHRFLSIVLLVSDKYVSDLL